MRIKHTTPRSGITRRTRLAAVVSVLLAATALFLPHAGAAPTGEVTPEAAAALAKSLGSDSTAGSYYDAESDSAVVNVTSDAAEQAVREAGAVPKRVKYSSAQLAKAGNAAEAAGVAGTAWGVDPKSNKLVVSADGTVPSAELSRLASATAAYGDAVSIQRIPGSFKKLISGGDAVYGGDYRCSLGFNVVSGSTYYFLTAGHCAEAASSWYADSGRTTPIGTNAGYSFPDNDYALVRYSNTSIEYPGAVGNQDIASAGDAYVGQPVTRRGSTTGIHKGMVTGLDYTVDYGGRDVVHQMIRTNVCAEPGDSGGPLYSGSTALGLTSGGSGDCTSGGTTFFQPVTEALGAYGVSVY